MCGRYTFEIDAPTLQQAFGLVPTGFSIKGGHNIGPGRYIIFVRPESGQRVADVAYWGLIPGWVKDPNEFSKPINARAETIEEKPSFRTAFKRKRVIIPASGFYEWKAEGKAKRPFYIHPTEEPFFAFAGLMEDWQGPNGEVMISACIITTDPNELMAGIHNRMPVILPRSAWDLWLDPASQTREVKPLLVPYPQQLMAAHEVGPEVGNVRNDHPGLILPVSA
ncbi:SOS response-associated peptidase [Geothrix sp. PMB-07]|uniref:SOS response-associated peptidase n=1 Tax=Geothrix sp. PMB-07 TaxID=3068640 RepID=UPI0027413621|nr:SOS response-associated peptidase [Geothrix sp. PMB-07]WLT31135.1 SOS response-associated peptidase [Geothrix sp. PMB-07]